MPIGIIVLGCVAFICVTMVVLKYLDKRDVNADVRAQETAALQADQESRERYGRRGRGVNHARK